MSRIGKPLIPGERRLLVAVGVFVAAIFGLLWWWLDINTDPVVSFPPARAAGVGYDLCARAGSQVQVILTRNPAQPAEQIDLSEYLGAKQQGSAYYGPTPEPTLAEIRKIDSPNAPHIAVLRYALRYPMDAPSYQIGDHRNDAFCKMTNALFVAGYVRKADANWNSAMDCYLDAIQLWTAIPHDYSLFPRVSYLSIVRSEIWEVIDHLDAPHARADAQRMEQLITRQQSLVEIMQETKYYEQTCLLCYFHQPGWRYTSEGVLPDKLGVLLMSKRKIMADYTGYVDACIANAQFPYAARKADPPYPATCFDRNMNRSYAGIPFLYTMHIAQNALLTVSLALHAYQLDHGNYPATLTALVPGYLKTIPDDPFALKGLLRYRLKGQHYVLYSVGPDGKDDGGVPSKDGVKTKPPKNGMPVTLNFLKNNSTGDIVAGVNIR